MESTAYRPRYLLSVVILGVAAAAIAYWTVQASAPELSGHRLYQGLVILALAVVGMPIIWFALLQNASVAGGLRALGAQHNAAIALCDETASLADQVRADFQNLTSDGDEQVGPLAPGWISLEPLSLGGAGEMPGRVQIGGVGSGGE